MKQWIVVFVMSCLWAQGVYAMGFFSKPTHCVFSAVSGHLLSNGKPVKHARLVRTGQLGHAKEKVTDEVITDENGYFEFPDMYQSASEFGGLAAFRVFQAIHVVDADGVQQEIWNGVKRDGLKGGENRNNPWSMQCDISSDEKVYLVNGASFFTVCAWDVEKDPVPSPNKERWE